MGIEEVFIDPCLGCEYVVPGIVTPGGPPSPPSTRRWGGIRKKNLTMDVEVHAPSLSKALEKGLSFEIQKFEKVNYLSTEM